MKYLENIRPFLREMIDDLKTPGEWKPNLRMKTNFVSTKGLAEYRPMYSVILSNYK